MVAFSPCSARRFTAPAAYSHAHPHLRAQGTHPFAAGNRTPAQDGRHRKVRSWCQNLRDGDGIVIRAADENFPTYQGVVQREGHRFSRPERK